MKILVTGARGQVGSALCRLAAASGFEVIGLDAARLDITCQDSIDNALRLYQPGLVVNAAAYTAVDKAESEESKARLVNATSVGYLASMTADRAIPLIHISTDYVFSGEKATPYTEEDATGPLGVYGQTKLEGEQLAMQYNKKTFILRTSWVFGREGNNFPKTMLRLARERDVLGVVADQIGCPTYADDIAKAIYGIAGAIQTTAEQNWGVYHYAGEMQCSWHGFASFIIRQAYNQRVIEKLPRLKELTTTEYPTAARRPGNSVLDCGKLHREFPQIALSDWKSGILAVLG